jgi:hypothetical protein
MRIAPAADALTSCSSAVIAAAISGPGVSIMNAPTAAAPTKATFESVLLPPSAAVRRSRSTTANQRKARQPSMKRKPPRMIVSASSWMYARYSASEAFSSGAPDDAEMSTLTTHNTTATTPAHLDQRSAPRMLAPRPPGCW